MSSVPESWALQTARVPTWSVLLTYVTFLVLLNIWSRDLILYTKILQKLEFGENHTKTINYLSEIQI